MENGKIYDAEVCALMTLGTKRGREIASYFFLPLPACALAGQTQPETRWYRGLWIWPPVISTPPSPPWNRAEWGQGKEWLSETRPRISSESKSLGGPSSSNNMALVVTSWDIAQLAWTKSSCYLITSFQYWGDLFKIGRVICKQGFSL